MDKSNLLDVVGAEGAEVGVLAVGGHRDVLQRGRGTYLHHNRSVPKLIPGKAELDKIPGQKVLYRGGHPYRPLVLFSSCEKIIEVRNSRPGGSLVVGANVIPPQIRGVIHDPCPSVETLGGKVGAVAS